MARWLTPLDHRQLTGRRWWLLAPLIYDSDLLVPVVPDGRLILPVEFIYNGASVPRLPGAYLVAGGRAWGPAALHDYGYQRQLGRPREFWDAVFREAMAVHQPELGHDAEPAWARVLMWGGVRAGGWVAWDRREDRAKALNPVWDSSGWPDVAQAP